MDVVLFRDGLEVTIVSKMTAKFGLTILKQTSIFFKKNC
jgi:hypothetical protein